MGILKLRHVVKIALLAGGFAACLAQPVNADNEPMQLYAQKIEAGLVYNFLKYTSWPAGPNAKQLRVCLYGDDDPFDGYLYPLDGRTAQQAVIQITQIKTPAGLSACQMIFIHKTNEDSLGQILDAVSGQPVMTISDIPDFSRRGGMVEFKRGDDQRIHLLINKDAVDKGHLEIQPRILKLATLVSQTSVSPETAK